MNERMKKIRADARLSMRAFADRIGVTSSSVAKLESGENNPSEQTIRAICREFNIRREWLETGEGEMRSNASGLVPELVRVLQRYPALKAMLEEMLDYMGPDEWEMLNRVVAKGLEARTKKEEQ